MSGVIKKYHVGKNLFNYKTATPFKGSFDNNGVFYATDNDDATSLTYKIQLYSGTSPIQSSTRAITVNATGTYRITSAIKVTSDVTRIRFANNGRSSEFSVYCYIDATKFLDDYISIVFTVDNTTIGASVVSNIMYYKGNAALDYEPFVTDNLFNEIYPNIDSSLHYSAIYVGDGQFTMSTTCPRNQSGACLFFLAGDVSSGASTESNGVWGYSGTSYGTMTRTQTAVNGYVTIAYRSLSTELNPVNEDTMLNSGSTAKPYTPYGSVWNDIPYRRYETATDVVTSLPVKVYGDGETDISLLLKGNTTTSGTPSPQNPITISGVGEETANLFDKSVATDNSRVLYTTGEVGSLTGVDVSDYIPIESGEKYTLNIFDSTLTSKTGQLFALYDNTKIFVDTGAHAVTAGQTVYSFTVPSGCAYIRFNSIMTAKDNVMFVKGDYTAQTFPSYEPYGYKISILKDSQALTPIYLSQPLRKSLDGTAFDTLDSTGLVTYNVDEYGQPQTATTETVTVPTITTTGGTVTLDVDTTIKPSEMSLTYHGWHEHQPLKRENGSWS